MKLISASPSPFARKVRVLLHETGQTDAVEVVDVMTTATNTNPEVAAANPAGKVPALVREDGPTVYDSRVICRFLDAKYAAGLYPESRIRLRLSPRATGRLAQLAERLVYTEDVGGSIPSPPTIRQGPRNGPGSSRTLHLAAALWRATKCCIS